jgi:tetratricopeptide (TPR) repeat protein
MRKILIGVALGILGQTAWADENLTQDQIDALDNQCATEVHDEQRDKACTALINANDERIYLPATYYNRAVARLDMSQTDLAIADATQSLTLEPEYSGAYMVRGQAYGTVKRYDESIADATKAIALTPELYKGYAVRGTTYALQGKYQLAIADLTEAIARNADFNVYRSRGWSYHLMGDDAKALPDLMKAAELSPDNGGVLDLRGFVQEKLGNKEAAIADYRAALKLSNGDSLAWSGLKRLDARP